MKFAGCILALVVLPANASPAHRGGAGTGPSSAQENGWQKKGWLAELSGIERGIGGGR